MLDLLQRHQVRLLAVFRKYAEEEPYEGCGGGVGVTGGGGGAHEAGEMDLVSG